MTLEKFQRIVLRLGNQMFVRHYLWINYPNDPQMMAVELTTVMPKSGLLARRNRGEGRLEVEMQELGFVFNEDLGTWEIVRTEGTAEARGEVVARLDKHRQGLGRTPFETFTSPTCKGCYALGTACGECERCDWERAQMPKGVTP